MASIKFGVTYEVVGLDDDGDIAVLDRGFIGDRLSLREAVETVRATRTSRVGGVEAVECDSWPVTRCRWVTVQNGMEYETSSVESRSLHVPEGVSDSSSRRIARLVGATV